ncbi:DUF1127 domain-containing protein [Pseudomonas sp. Pse1]|uniref:DUF1127 domain-containing protein n=1 Tax=Pseudomonas sp. Pse1 TaxID=2926020 RepID=UPI002118B05E|nr:DUF1127 domain-containing protein [Pseudomonas sp. Pse1]
MERQRTPVRAGARTAGQRLRSAVAQVNRWRQLSQNRAELARLSNEQLRDIGLNRLDVLRETSRPFWDDPLKR